VSTVSDRPTGRASLPDNRARPLQAAITAPAQRWTDFWSVAESLEREAR
jgi:hypothetical protein